MTIVVGQRLPRAPGAVFDLAKKLLHDRPPCGTATTPRGMQSVANPERRAWGELFARVIEALSDIPADNNRLRVMMNDAPEILNRVLERRAVRR